MKRSIFSLSSFALLLVFLSFAVSGCSKSDEQKDAEDTAAETAGAAETAETAGAAETAETAGAAETVPSANTSALPETSSDEIVKPAELDKAVEAHIQKILQENQDIAKAEPPQQMTYFFIRALQMENEDAVLGMLTLDAYREMKRLQKETGQKGLPCPDFIKTSDVVLGNVQYLSDETDEEKVVGAHVGTIWRVPSENGVMEENIAWVFRFEDETWLVAGMLSIVDTKYPPILVNFENMEDTEEQAKLWQEEVERIEKGGDAPAAQNAPDAAVSDLGTDPKPAADAEISTENGAVPADGPELPAETPAELSGELPAELPAEL